MPSQSPLEPAPDLSVEDAAEPLERTAGERGSPLWACREPAKSEIVSSPGAVLVPKGDALSGAALADMPQDRPVVHGNAGERLAEVLAALRDAGFADAVHAGGGTAAWTRRVEPERPRYWGG